MTIYNISIITSTGFPFFHKEIKKSPDGIKLFQRFFDFTEILNNSFSPGVETAFELNAGLISALFGFAKNLNKQLKVLEFKSSNRESTNEILQNKRNYKGDALITVQTETYLLHKAIKEKINLIYNLIIQNKIPLENSEILTEEEEEKIIDILLDNSARNKIYSKQIQIEIQAEKYLKEMEQYGLFNIVITSSDLSPIAIFGSKYTFKDIEIILRNLGEITEIEPFEWIFRQSFYKKDLAWVYLVNSGIGLSIEGLFEPFYYLLLTNFDSYLGEFPRTLTDCFNDIIS